MRRLPSRLCMRTEVAVELGAVVQFEREARRGYEGSPWNLDRQADDVVRPAPIPTGEHVPPKSVARETAVAKLQLQIMAAAKANCAGTGTSWTSMRTRGWPPCSDWGCSQKLSEMQDARLMARCADCR